MQFNGKEFRQYDASYYVSADGDIYSKHKKGLLKHYIDLDGYHRVDIHSRHMKVHKLVYMCWVGPIPDGKQLNHRDDDKDNNHYTNLYLGTQKKNIHDCIKNGTRKGHLKPITILEKSTGRIIPFATIKDFIQYTGHSVPNGAISKCKQFKWFQNNYAIIETEGVETIENGDNAASS